MGSISRMWRGLPYELGGCLYDPRLNAGNQNIYLRLGRAALHFSREINNYHSNRFAKVVEFLSRVRLLGDGKERLIRNLYGGCFHMPLSVLWRVSAFC